MKTRITAVAFILLTVLAIAAYAQQYDPESDFKAELMEDGNSVRIVEYRGEKWTVRIPPKIQDIPVTHIGNKAFKDTKITSVIIPDGVTNIDDMAFHNCTSLTSVTIPNSVTSIGNSVFVGCSKLANITIPNSVASIGNSAFELCTSLKNVTLPNNIISIGEAPFAGCTSLSAINVAPDNSAYTALNGVLYNKDKSVLHTYPAGKKGNFIIPNGVTTIENGAFEQCTSLTSITIPNSVTNIGRGAFLRCYSLASVTIGNGVTSIGNVAFSGCTSLKSINIPNSVISIGEFAFSGCTNLISVTIPNSITKIDDLTFEGCKNLTSVIIPNSIISIGEKAFLGCEKLTSVTFQGTINWAFFSNDAFPGNLRDEFYAINTTNGTPGTYYRTSNPRENDNSKWWDINGR